MNRLPLVALVTTLAACGSTPSPKDSPPLAAAPATAADATKIPKSLFEAVHADYRAPENRARDIYRHPIETLGFFKISLESTVVELEPGRGWYTEILAPFLRSAGHYVAVVNPKYPGAGAWLHDHPEYGAKADVVEFKSDGTFPAVADRSADLVLTFRNAHNWMRAGVAPRVFASAYRVLKPGGIFGVVDHRAREKSKLDPESGYVRERDLIAMAEAAGFRLDARSEINANPKDTTVHPRGVCTLPPSLKMGEVDKAKYLAIGESDRTTLRFVKPR